MATRTAVVAGDITIDWMLAKPRDLTAPPPYWTNDVKAAAFSQAGGAALLAELLRRSARESWHILGPRVTTELLQERYLSAENPDYDHAFSIWAPYPEHVSRAPERTRWRISEFQGWNDQLQGDKADYAVVDDDATADIVVLIDAGLGFSDRESQWPKAVTEPKGGKPDWVVLRLNYTQPGGKLWNHLVDRFADRLIVLTSVRDLRQMHAQISKQLSWERTARETAWEVAEGKQLNSLSSCAWIVTSIGRSGAELLPGSALPQESAQLVFDSRAMEGEWERAYEGRVLGSSTCMTAAVATELMANPEGPELLSALKTGIAAQRRLFEVGYGAGGPTDRAGVRLPDALEFPFGDIVNVIRQKGEGEGKLHCEDGDDAADAEALCRLTTVPVAADNPSHDDWSILEFQHPRTGGLEELAVKIVEEGVDKALADVPITKFKGLVIVDRHETEAVRSIERLISEYCKRGEQTPLCLAVFGPPGSGKSFAVEQVAKHTLSERVEALDFNLSQFSRPENLLEAFHRVRDVNLSGKLPLVIWDEFDTGARSWLRYFLQPMQSGKFQQGEITHPIGRCIFVFAGGTADNMEGFKKDLHSAEQRNAKVPDFVSRLHGYIDVLGPNRHSTVEFGDPQWEAEDPYFIVRRAVILRSILERGELHLKHGSKVHIDPGVLRAFLKVRKYKHGIRSMMSVVKTSLLADAKTFEISSLPPEEQLDLHVTEDFLDLARAGSPIA